jgi:hypothetical protein
MMVLHLTQTKLSLLLLQRKKRKPPAMQRKCMCLLENQRTRAALDKAVCLLYAEKCSISFVQRKMNNGKIWNSAT